MENLSGAMLSAIVILGIGILFSLATLVGTILIAIDDNNSDSKKTKDSKSD